MMVSASCESVPLLFCQRRRSTIMRSIDPPHWLIIKIPLLGKIKFNPSHTEYFPDKILRFIKLKKLIMHRGLLARRRFGTHAVDRHMRAPETHPYFHNILEEVFIDMMEETRYLRRRT